MRVSTTILIDMFEGLIIFVGKKKSMEGDGLK